LTRNGLSQVDFDLLWKALDDDSEELSQLEHIDLSHNQIFQLRPPDGTTTSPTVIMKRRRLKSLNLFGNPLMVQNVEENHRILLQIVDDYPRLGSVREALELSRLFSRTLESKLDFNRVGRELCQTTTQQPTENSYLPLWPIVLERANRLLEDQTSERQANAIHQLLMIGSGLPVGPLACRIGK
jgi:hypothetical protein